jgi:broad specificity phosphatase PhoE
VEDKYGPYMAYCFDNAVSTFGSALEADLDGIEGKTSKEINQKRDRTLRKWLGLPMRFRNPGGPTATRQTGSTAEQQFSVRG